MVNMTRLKVETGANKPMTDMLGSMLVLKTRKLCGNPPKLDPTERSSWKDPFMETHVEICG